MDKAHSLIYFACLGLTNTPAKNQAVLRLLVIVAFTSVHSCHLGVEQIKYQSPGVFSHS